MPLSGLHLLLTYQCPFECDHCFVWAGPRQSATLTTEQIATILAQAESLDTLRWIYFEGGEPFLYHPVLVRAVELASASGFKVGLVSNGYWATAEADAEEWLRPFAGMVHDLSISSDLFHFSEKLSRQSRIASDAAGRLGIPVDVITISDPGGGSGNEPTGQLPHGESPVRFRGRAASVLAAHQPKAPWHTFTECPCEDLRDPGRVHIDPLGSVHICQGLTIGNLFERALVELWAGYDPEHHPIIGPLLSGGPAELARSLDLTTEEGYADACHLCYEARRQLRCRFPELLGPDQMYGIASESE